MHRNHYIHSDKHIRNKSKLAHLGGMDTAGAGAKAIAQVYHVYCFVLKDYDLRTHMHMVLGEILIKKFLL